MKSMAWKGCMLCFSPFFLSSTPYLFERTSIKASTYIVCLWVKKSFRKILPLFFPHISTILLMHKVGRYIREQGNNDRKRNGGERKKTFSFTRKVRQKLIIEKGVPCSVETTLCEGRRKRNPMPKSSVCNKERCETMIMRLCLLYCQMIVGS